MSNNMYTKFGGAAASGVASAIIDIAKHIPPEHIKNVAYALLGAIMAGYKLSKGTDLPKIGTCE